MNLEGLFTRTTVSFSASLAADSLRINDRSERKLSLPAWVTNRAP
jgi:hypothetical protein